MLRKVRFSNTRPDLDPQERGKAGGNEPPLLPLSGHILAFLSSGSHEPPVFPLSYHHSWLFRAILLF